MAYLRRDIVSLFAALVGFAVAGMLAARPDAQAPVSRAASQRVVAAAQAFLTTLRPEQRAIASVELNARTRAIWSNLPPAASGPARRNGLTVGDMTDLQEKAAMALLAAALSREGFEKVMAVVGDEEERHRRIAPFRPANAPPLQHKEFYLAILGQPAANGAWMMQFGGHHLAINVTFAGGAQVLTPTHTGADPASYAIEGGRTVRPLGDEHDKAVALIDGLTADQRTQAALGVQVRDLVLGPGEDGRMIAPEGVRVSTFTATQRAQLLDLIGEWVRIISDEAAAAKMADVGSQLDETYFAWAGSTTNGSDAYFRIQGPTVFIEYAPESPDHIHTIYRDPTNDYAAKAIGR